MRKILLLFVATAAYGQVPTPPPPPPTPPPPPPVVFENTTLPDGTRIQQGLFNTTVTRPDGKTIRCTQGVFNTTTCRSE